MISLRETRRGQTQGASRRALHSLALLACAALLGGCALMPRPAVVPLPSLSFASPCTAAGADRADTLVVMLPGAYSLPQEFVDEGFVQALQQRRLAVDVLVVDSHLGYFNNGSVMQRLRQDVLAPARARGYRQVWLVGISLGGFGALAYAAEQGREAGHGVDGVLAIAPYLGSRRLLTEVTTAGGPLVWARSDAVVNEGRAAAALPRPSTPDGAERGLWRWLGTPPVGSVPVHLGYGSEDRLRQGHLLLAGALPAARVLTVSGGHDWPPWRALWTQWLDTGALGAARCAAVP